MAELNSHTSCGRSTAYAHRVALPSHEQGFALMHCGHFATSAYSSITLKNKLQPLRSFCSHQCFAITRATAASRPPLTATFGSHTSCSRFAASAHSCVLLSHKLRPLRGLRSRQHLLLQELRPLCGSRASCHDPFVLHVFCDLVILASCHDPFRVAAVLLNDTN